MSTLDAQAMLDRLPHGEPFRFITRLIELEPGVSGSGQWCVVGDEAFFAGHFPGQPVVPGVLIAEALAQLSGLVGRSMNTRGGALTDRDSVNNGPAVLAHVDIRFKQAVVPPAEVLLRSRLTRALGTLQQFEVEASIGTHRVARGSLALADPPPATQVNHEVRS